MLDMQRREGFDLSAETQEGGFVRPWQVLDWGSFLNTIWLNGWIYLCMFRNLFRGNNGQCPESSMKIKTHLTKKNIFLDIFTGYFGYFYCLTVSGSLFVALKYLGVLWVAVVISGQLCVALPWNGRLWALNYFVGYCKALTDSGWLWVVLTISGRLWVALTDSDGLCVAMME